MPIVILQPTPTLRLSAQRVLAKTRMWCVKIKNTTTDYLQKKCVGSAPWAHCHFLWPGSLAHSRADVSRPKVVTVTRTPNTFQRIVAVPTDSWANDHWWFREQWRVNSRGDTDVGKQRFHHGRCWVWACLWLLGGWVDGGGLFSIRPWWHFESMQAFWFPL